MYERIVDVPRLVSFYGEGEALPHPLLDEALEQLNRHYGPMLGEPLVTAGLCLYRDGHDSVAWHGDTIGRGRHADTVVAILSLGSERALHLRERGGGSSRRFRLGPGDLLVMGGSCQRTHEHAVPKTAAAVGPRISVQFRPAGCGEAQARVLLPFKRPDARRDVVDGRGSSARPARRARSLPLPAWPLPERVTGRS